MKVNPFYSRVTGTSVHHDNNKCTTGNNIETYNRVGGKGGLPLCYYCQNL